MGTLGLKGFNNASAMYSTSSQTVVTHACLFGHKTTDNLVWHVGWKLYKLVLRNAV